MSSFVARLAALYIMVSINCLMIQERLPEHSLTLSFLIGLRMSLGLVSGLLMLDRILFRMKHLLPLTRDDEIGHAVNLASIKQTATIGCAIMVARLCFMPINKDRLCYEFGYGSGFILALLICPRPDSRKPRRKRRTSSLIVKFRALVRGWQNLPSPVARN